MSADEPDPVAPPGPPVPAPGSPALASGAGDRAIRHSRQLRIPELGPAGQERLAAAHVLVVGAGGLGSPVLQYLAAAGVGRLTVVDDDAVELSNLNRQTLHRAADVGRKKAERAAEFVAALDAGIVVEARVERLSVDNARDRVREADLCVDATDGLPTKYLLNDACVREGRPLVHGAVTAFAGQVLFVPPGGRPCLRCLFEEVPPPGTVPTCQTAGALGAACGVVGSLMAAEAVKALAGTGSLLAGRFLTVDVLAPRVREMRFAARADCPTCGEEWDIDARTREDYEGGPP